MRRPWLAALALGVGLIPGGARGQTVTTLAGSGSVGTADGTGKAASFAYPTGVAADANGNLYVADTDNNKIRKITPAGVVTTFAGSGSQGSQDGTGTAAAFNSPYGVAVGAGGVVYVADTGSNKIRKITSTGVVTTIAGSGAASSLDGNGTAASFNGPAGLAVDGNGNLYVADVFGDKIRKISPGGIVTTIAGSGVEGGDDGTGAAASFASPVGIAVDAGSNVFVADMFNNEIRKISPGGEVTTFAGSGLPDGVDGVGTAASFYWPSGVALDGAGNLYVADLGNSKIRKITPAGLVTTYAGSGQPGSADGTGMAASFTSPSGVAADTAGSLYVTDFDNNNVRKIAKAAGACTPNGYAACLVGGRYRVSSRWRNQYAGSQVSQLAAGSLTDTTAAFWLSSADIYEYLIRINTATDNGRAWISIPTFTDVEFWIAVTDTVNGQYYEYHSDPGNKTLVYDPSFFVYP
ncbi:MAG TPA: NHL repeat-containing protein [Thermoanaerobaculia bacterium]|nr:NHL repeat-containing protein [Thermoanaerobaculia bacterium]